MKPIVLAELAGSAGYGGGERYLELLFGRLARTEFSPILICPEPGPFVAKMRGKDIPTCVVHLQPLWNPLALVRLALLLKQQGVTILQTHGARANIYGLLAAWLAGVPCVVATVHNAIRDYEVGAFTRWLYGVILRVMLPWAHRIICVSDAIKQDVLIDSPNVANRAITIRNGVDSAVFTQPGNRDKIRNEWSVGNGPMLLTVARLTLQKGHRFLIEALSGLLTEWPSLVCLLVGEGECREWLHSLACEKGVERACRFVGSRDDMVDWYAAADVVVLPSLSEGFPFVVLEALAMARPVVATNVNGVPEIIQDGVNGVLIAPRDAQALAEAIRRLLRDPLWAARLAKAGQETVLARFTVGKMVQDTVAVFDEALRTLHGTSMVPHRNRQKEAA